MNFRAILLLVVVLFGAGPARADYVSSERWFTSLDETQRVLIQTDLVLLGLYDRLVDGEFGPGTYKAILRYQSEAGTRQDGVLTSGLQARMQSEASAIYGRLGIDVVEDRDIGLGLFLPLTLLDERTESDRGKSYYSADRQIEVETSRQVIDAGGFADIYAATISSDPASIIAYRDYDDRAFTITGKLGDKYFYYRFYNGGSASVGYSLRWTAKYRTVGTMLSILLASLSYPLDATGPHVNPPAGSRAADTYSSGSGFFFAEKGMIATNYHVAADCTELTVVGYGPAALIRGDEASDLAAVQLESKWSPAWAKIRATPPQLAESVLLLGYPLADILESSLNVSTGIISSETGLAGEKGWFTTNAGIQPGNSGGPLLDASGNVVGVAVAKIDDAALLANAGTTASNVGFGIKSTRLLEFLDIFQHSIGTETELLSPQEISKLGKQFTVQLICRQNATDGGQAKR